MNPIKQRDQQIAKLKLALALSLLVSAGSLMVTIMLSSFVFQHQAEIRHRVELQTFGGER